MGAIDYAIIGLYFVVVIGLGFWFQKKAAENLEAYFLGGNRIHWLALALSGAISNFDITGTMWIVSMLVILGMKSMWIHWMWGCMLGAFCLAFMGKWVRRSNVMTGAEWMVTRFGNDAGGRLARSAYAFMAVLTLSYFIGYSFEGIGKFASVYVGLPPAICAIVIFVTTTIYVLLGGMYSVVVTDIIQTIILTISSILIAFVAYMQVSPDTLAAVLPQGWTSLMPRWRLDELSNTENATYEWFGLLAIVWVMKGFLLNAGGPAQMYDFQRFLSARNPRDAAKVGAAWSFFLIPRWGMAMGIVLLSLAGISNIDDPEKVMPIVLHDFIPIGLKGFVIAGLLSAFMSTFSATVNSAASYLIRDFWQPFFRPEAKVDELIQASYVATIAVVIVGIAIGFQAESIADIWNWMMMALGAGVIMPNFLRWYWWRLNGWGYAAGTLGGILMSLIAWFQPDAPQYLVFPVIVLGSLTASVVVSLISLPVSESILVSFYKTVRPFGAWGPIQQKAGLNDRRRDTVAESPGRAALNTVLGIIAITGYYLFPMYLVGHWHVYSAICLTAALGATVLLYFTWYRTLPDTN